MPRSSMLGSHISLIPENVYNHGHTHITIVVHLSSSGELTRSIGLSLKEGDVNSDSQRQVVDENARHSSDGVVHQTQSEHATLVSLNDADDEFFDVPEPSDSDELEKDGCLIVVTRSLRLEEGLCGLTRNGQRRKYLMLLWINSSKRFLFWAEPDPSTFLIRGANYLEDRQKVKAKGTLMQMVAANWVRSDKREDDLGATTYNLALYYMMTTPVEDTPLLESFMKGDDTYRNSRFKLIPYISKLGVDIGLLTIARGVVSLVFGYFNHLVIEMAFLIQGNTQEELSEEFLSGTCRLNHLEF
ncbi:hypothetical protein Ahy_A08g039620 isoform D [Arachis hypogaea]|uniref:Protein ENHANCED DISEASE RESISTANCE 2 C-terminal domain-containing protein n=1 Tax=Arachis hypogaea TaxID=3818 RepID=A0A445BWS4_ARAHY|nr:hypothetical protein Ahy_A08g039620 isoform D [Arachis hypogaea]